MKKLLATLLASAMALTTIGGLVACGDDGNGDDPNTITVWAPENSLGDEEAGTGYKGMIAGFKEAYPDYAKYNIKFVAKGEGDAKNAIGTNPKGAAEVFFFASDHYKDLTHDNVLQPLTEDYETKVKERDAQGTYEFVTDSSSKIRAFPATNDNGFFLWYNDQYLNEDDVKNLDTILEKCKEQNKHMHLEYNNSWYSATFMFGLGCKFNYDANGNYKHDATSNEAKAAAKAMYYYANHANNKAAISDEDEDGNVIKTNTILQTASFTAGLADGSVACAVSYVSSMTDIESAVKAYYTADGVTDTESVTEALKHIKATTLPKFKATVEGGQEKDYYMGTFYGGKYCGVNRQKSTAKIKVALALADWFTNKAGQTVRFEADGSGPSNLEVAQLPAVKESVGLQAYNAQVALGTEYNCVQGAQTDGFWGDTGIKLYVTGIFEQKTGYTTEAEVLAKLTDLATGIA